MTKTPTKPLTKFSLLPMIDWIYGVYERLAKSPSVPNPDNKVSLIKFIKETDLISEADTTFDNYSYNDFMQDLEKIFTNVKQYEPKMVMCGRCGNIDTVGERMTCSCGYLEQVWKYFKGQK